MEPPAKNGKAENVSYRHLFTFAGDTQDGLPSTVEALSNSRQFTFSGSGIDAFQAAKNVNEDPVEHLEDEEGDQYMHDASGIQPDSSTGAQLAADGNTVQEEDLSEMQDTNMFRLPVNNERTQNKHQYALNHEYGQSLEEEPAFQLPDDIFSRPEALQEIASHFVRTSTIGDLEEQWERVDGSRDQMRRDFKIRRQKAAGNVRI